MFDNSAIEPITVRVYSLENEERYNVVLVKRISNCCLIPGRLQGQLLSHK